METGFMPFIFLVVLFAVPFWRIVKRAGLPPALSLLGLIPGANVIFIWVFAFVEWPALKQLQSSPSIQ